MRKTITTIQILFVIFYSLYLSRCRELGGHKISNLSSYSLLGLSLLTFLVIIKNIKKTKLTLGDCIFSFYVLASFVFSLISKYPTHSINLLKKYLPVQLAIYICIRYVLSNLNLKRQIFLWWASLFFASYSPFLIKTNWIKPVGVFSYANVYANFAMIFIILTLSLSFNYPFLLITLIAPSYGMVKCSSRMSLIALFCSITAAIIAIGITNLNRKRLSAIFAAYITFATFLGLMILKTPKVKAELSRLTKIQEDKSAQIRLKIAKLCVDLFAERPLIGWGYGRTTRMMLKDPQMLPRIRKYLGWMTKNFYEGRCHNALLELSVQAGIWGLIIAVLIHIYPLLLLVFLIKELKKGDIKSNFTEVILLTTPIIAMLALSINMLTEILLFSKKGLLLFSCMAFSANVEELLKSKSSESPSSPPPTSSSAPD